MTDPADDHDPNELYSVPESEQLELDPGHDDEHTGGEPDDLSDAPEGSDDVIVWFGDDDDDEEDADHLPENLEEE